MKKITAPKKRNAIRIGALGRLAALSAMLAVVSSTALANPALFAEAKRLLAAMNAKQAYMLLVAEQDKLIGNVEFDYLIGVAALDSGRIDEAIIAFERVLAVQPNNAGAQLDLARAYFNAGSLDLSEGTFLKLKTLNPPAPAMMAIDKYLAAIAERRRAAKRMLSVWGEMALGYDSNLTGVPNDFTTAVAQAFNLVGVNATGNSIKRKAPFLGAAVGVDAIFPIAEKWNAYVGGDLRGRGYQKEGEFNSATGELRASAVWDGGSNQVRLNSSYNAFQQAGDAPGDPKPKNDRRSAIGGAEWRLNLQPTKQLSFALYAGQTRFPKNNVEDFDSTIASVAWLTTFAGAKAPVLQLTAFGTRDKAVRKLADGITDKSKRVEGLRAYGQLSLSEKLSVFTAIGLSQRRDDSAFSRATTVEFGRDRLGDLTLGTNWRFQDRCNLRVQLASSRSNSNIDIYDYTRHEVSSTIRCEFM